MISTQSPRMENAPAERFMILERAIQKTQDLLLRNQDERGYWVGELEADASVAAGYISLMYFMRGEVDSVKQAKVINYVKNRQNDDGSWSCYHGGPGDLNVTVQVYFALKAAGIPASDPDMQKARDFVLAKGGLMQTNTITRVWLALFGQFDYRGTPSIPAEIIYLPNWFYLNIYEFASWSRETIMALTLILNTKPVCDLPDHAHIDELYVEPKGNRRFAPAKRDDFFSWKSFFLAADWLFKIIEKLPIHKPALRRVEKWVLDHQEADGSWGGIMLPWIYSLMALKSLGYENDHPVIKKGLDGLAAFLVEDSRHLRMQPAVSPVWDTSWSTLALLESGLAPNHPAVVKACRWLLNQEIRFRGDWSIKNPFTEAGCWAFEFDNQYYPDIDDTAVVSRALLRIQLIGGEELAKLAAAQRGCNWVQEMQSSNGGWAAFDRDNNKQILAHLPYGDFMTPLDPTSADVTAHALELIGKMVPKSPALRKAIRYLKKTQETDGTWYGRWGVNYIYGTSLVLVSLKAAGEAMNQQYLCEAADWLQGHQNPDGGWGETCETYTDPTLKGKGPSTASQTAWALMGLMATGQGSSRSVENGIHYLLRHQNEDGAWDEEAYTGTGFPKAFYLRYDLYRVYFPLLALCQYRSSIGE